MFTKMQNSTGGNAPTTVLERQLNIKHCVEM